ncbi:MAG: hypothetical protein MJY82_06115, partial [Fibrobacter sp.]|nr:hypothetical protein [Fibrobacter sp.]
FSWSSVRRDASGISRNSCEGGGVKNEHEKSFLEEFEKWRKDYNVTDDSVAKVLNRKSRELSNAKKNPKIWDSSFVF